MDSGIDCLKPKANPSEQHKRHKLEFIGWVTLGSYSSYSLSLSHDLKKQQCPEKGWSFNPATKLEDRAIPQKGGPCPT